MKRSFVRRPVRTVLLGALLLAVMLAVPVVAGASNGGYLTLNSGRYTYISSYDPIVSYYYTPWTSGTYTFYSTGSCDTIGGIAYEYSTSYLATDDDSGTGLNFRVSAYLIAGSTYRFDSIIYNGGTGGYTVFLTGGSGSSSGSTGSSTRSTTPVSSGTLTAGGSQWVNISSAGQVRRYSFTPYTSGTYTLYSTGSYDTYVTLYRSGSSSSLASNDDGGSGNNFSLSYYLSGGTTYYFDVKMWSSSRTGSFTIYLTRDSSSGSSSSGSTRSTSPVSSGTLTVGSSTNVYIGTAGQVRRYSFTPSTTGSYTIYSTGSNDTYVTLYRAGSSSSLSYNDDGGSGTNFSLTYNLTGGTTYYFDVKMWSSSRTGSFTIYLTRNSTSSSTSTIDGTLSLNSTRTVSITYGGQVRRYAFTPTISGTYTIYSTGSNDTYVTLYRAGSSTSLAHNDDSGTNNNFSLSYYLSAGTTYYFDVKMWSSSRTGSFSIRLTR